MKRNFGGHTGLPIPHTLSVSMTLCEELHLVGFGCKYEEECRFDDDGRCLMQHKEGE
jgi:hypothetical protein